MWTTLHSQITCTNFSELCVKSVDGAYYTLANASILQDPNFVSNVVQLYSLCEYDQTSKKRWKNLELYLWNLYFHVVLYFKLINALSIQIMIQGTLCALLDWIEWMDGWWVHKYAVGNERRECALVKSYQ